MKIEKSVAYKTNTMPATHPLMYRDRRCATWRMAWHDVM